MLASRVARDYPLVTWWCPQLPPSPRAAMAMLEEGIATWLAEQLGCKAVLLNPAVEPARDLASHIGEQVAWHDPQERFVFEPEFVEELRALQCGGPHQPQNYFAVIAKGDEVLDWREMQARYPGAAVRLLEGGDHALSDFDAHIEALLDFLDLAR